MEEVWKDIPDYEGFYEVSNYCRIRNKKSGRIRQPYLTSNYYSINLSKNNKVKRFRIHRLGMLAFVPNPYNLPEINHKDENKFNNFIFVNPDGSVDFEKSNLEWCDRQYNVNYGTAKQRAAEKTKNGKCSRPVNQYDIQGNFIKHWPSIIEIERSLGFGRATVYRNCIGKFKQAYGFKWAYS